MLVGERVRKRDTFPHVGLAAHVARIKRIALKDQATRAAPPPRPCFARAETAVRR
jgi:hypothetical protein